MNLGSACTRVLSLMQWYSGMGGQHHLSPWSVLVGTTFTVEHALSCPRGGLPTIRHNEIQDITLGLLTEVCQYIMIEPNLQLLTGEALTRATSNTVNPHAPTNKNTKCYRKHETEKKWAY